MQTKLGLGLSLLLSVAVGIPVAFSAETVNEGASPKSEPITQHSTQAPVNSEPVAPHVDTNKLDLHDLNDPECRVDECKISLVDPHVACAESQKVLDVLHKLVKAYSSGDMKTYEEYLDDHCTTFDESTKKLVSGKANVLADVKQRIHTLALDGPTPLRSFTIDQPYAKVTGDTAVVTFVAYRELGGKHPVKEKCHVTDVFVKRGDTWKKLHFRGSWKKA